MAPGPARAAEERVVLDEISVAAEAPRFGGTPAPGAAGDASAAPAGETLVRIGRDAIADRAAPNIGAVLRDSPGVTVRQDNGGRDVVISIRGSNAQSASVNRNIVVLEDGFPLTQPDGISRFDLTDPRAYQNITVFRGPQSPLFGNYAVGGAIAFTTRTGAQIDGAEVGADTGAFGYVNTYLAAGRASGPFDLALFTSATGANGYQDHASYDTQTVNAVLRYAPDPGDRFTLKVIDNRIRADLPARASLNQYRINPYQRGCAAAAFAAPGCTLTNLPRDGISGPSVGVTADEGAFGRDDRRTVVGARWEHDVDARTAWRAQLLFDERAFDQPYYVTSVRGSYPSWNGLVDLTHRHDLLGLPALTTVAASAGFIDIGYAAFNRAPYGGPRLGALTADFSGTQTNLSVRARTEVALSERWTAALGLGVERSLITGFNRAYAYPGGRLVATPTRAAPVYDDAAPELALVYRPDAAWALRGRAATGYATPTVSNLFVTAAGQSGDNTGLRPQTSAGLDLGADWTPSPGVALSVTGYTEAVRDELIAQSPGPGLLAYTFNAPASEHRGIEVGGGLRVRAWLARRAGLRLQRAGLHPLRRNAGLGRDDRPVRPRRPDDPGRLGAPRAGPARLRPAHGPARGPGRLRRVRGLERLLPRQRQPAEGPRLRPREH